MEVPLKQAKDPDDSPAGRPMAMERKCNFAEEKMRPKVSDRIGAGRRR